MEKNRFVELANVFEIPVRKMKHVRIDRNEILVEIVDTNRNMLRLFLEALDLAVMVKQ
jgi:hypothetical protein